jgi:carbon-monoxide dehydrogenase medium subunit
MGSRTLSEFEYLKPRSIGEAISLLLKYGDKAKVLAGGSDLFIDIKLHGFSPEYLVDITGITELKGITFNGKELRIGAATLLSEIADSQLIRDKYVTLFESVAELATTQVRNIATIGGNICNASPAADTAPPFIVLEAKAEIAGQSGVRAVLLEEFFTGPGQTALQAGDILTAILIPAPAQHRGTSFIRINRAASDLATLSVAVVLQTDNSVCQEVKIALGAVAPTPVRAKKAEAILKKEGVNQDTIAEAAGAITEEISPITDVRSTADYRKDVAVAITKRALSKAYERSKKS